MLALGRIALAAALALGAETAMGGWAVITVDQLPAALEAGGTTRVEFTLRQHGVTPLDDLAPTVEIRGAGGKRVEVPATPSGRPGSYAAQVPVPAAGPATIRIESGWGRGRLSQLTLLPLPVAGAGQLAAATSQYPRGEQLFVAKGCGTCHVNGDLPAAAAENQSLEVGPDLTGRQLEAGYLRQRLMDPQSLPPIGQRMVRMPNLGLSPAEVEALVAYLSGPRQTATR